MQIAFQNSLLSRQFDLSRSHCLKTSIAYFFKVFLSHLLLSNFHAFLFKKFNLFVNLLTSAGCSGITSLLGISTGVLLLRITARVLLLLRVTSRVLLLLRVTSRILLLLRIASRILLLLLRISGRVLLLRVSSSLLLWIAGVLLLWIAWLLLGVSRLLLRVAF